jgi:hypothetical protein
MEKNKLIELGIKTWKQGEHYNGFGIFTGFQVIDDKSVRCHFVTEGGTMDDIFTVHPTLGVFEHFDHYKESRINK